jgi:hypothetical protein
MKRGIMQVVLLSICLSPIFAQAQPPPHFTATYSLAANADPSGICTNEVRFWINNVTNDMFACYGGTWYPVGATFTGGTITSPLLAANGCTTPPYSFTAATAGGSCFDGANVILQRAEYGVSNTGVVALSSTSAAFLFNGAGLDNGFTASAGSITGYTAGVLRLTLVNDEFFTSLSGASNTTAALSLRDLTSNTFLSFTNVGTPANVISFAQNSSTPLLDMTVTDGTATGRFRNQPGGNAVSMNHTSGSESSTISVEVDGPNAVVTSTNGTSNSTIDVGGSGTTSISVNDGSGPVSSYFGVRGFVVPYAGDVASASTITPRGNVFHVTGTTTINTIAGTSGGMCLTLIFDDVVTVGDLTGNINIAAAFVSTANDTLSLCHDGTTWFETARSVN